MIKITISIIFFSLLISFSTFAETTNSDEFRSIVMRKGDNAPFDGILMDEKAIAKILTDKELSQQKCDLEKQRDLSLQKEKCNLDINNCKVSLDICNKKSEELLKIKDDELNKTRELLIKEQKSNSYREWYFVGGIVLGILLASGTSFAIYYGSQK